MGNIDRVDGDVDADILGRAGIDEHGLVARGVRELRVEQQIVGAVDVELGRDGEALVEESHVETEVEGLV